MVNNFKAEEIIKAKMVAEAAAGLNSVKIMAALITHITIR